MKTNYFIMGICALLLYSCSAMENQALRNNGSGKAGIIRIPQFENKNDKMGTFLWSHYDATQRGSVMYVKDGKIRVLAENSPDAAFQSMAEIAAKADVDGKVNAELAVKTQRTIAELGKRTAAVNMLRDALYRLNEMYYATAEEKKETINALISSPNLIQAFKDKENNKNFQYFASTIDSASLENLFKNIIDNAKEIAIAESEADKITVTAESNATIKTAEAEIKKIELLNALVSKLDGKLTKEEFEKFIKDNLNP